MRAFADVLSGLVLVQAPGTPTASMTPSASDDTPFGFGPAPSLTGSVAAFKRRCEWFYVDPNGEEHGPVPYAKLSSWYKKGHFPDDVKVCVLGCGAQAALPWARPVCYVRGFTLLHACWAHPSHAVWCDKELPPPSCDWLSLRCAAAAPGLASRHS